MATPISTIIDYVLGSLGRADVGEDRSAVLSDIADLLTADLPSEVEGYLIEGTVLLPVGYTGSVAEDGVYSLPTLMRGCSGILALIDDASMTDASRSPWPSSGVTITTVDDFYFDRKFGDAEDDSDYGKPSSALIYKNQIHLRPIPKQGATNEWFGNVVLFGRVAVDVTNLAESDSVDDDRIVPALKAGAQVLYCMRMHNLEAAQMWGAVYEKRKSELRAMMGVFPSNPQMPERDF